MNFDRERIIALIEPVSSLSEVVDLASPSLTSHQEQVAYISMKIAEEMGLSSQEQCQIALAGELHDIGFLSLEDRLKFSEKTFEIQNTYNHETIGYALLRKFKPLEYPATMIRFHHLPWDNGKGASYNNMPVPLGSHILHLADRIAVSIDKRKEILGQVDSIVKQILDHNETLFNPSVVKAFISLSNREYFWLDASSNYCGRIVKEKLEPLNLWLSMKDLLLLAELFAQIIDFRSPFTAHHSSGVAATAGALARLAGFSAVECQLMQVAGYLHDIGKLAVPGDILEKPGDLDDTEKRIMKSHVYYTYRTLQDISGFETINTWASLHHERLDGTGYPFHLTAVDLPLGSRIMAVADVFTAIMEDRPYRKGLESEVALEILDNMRKSALDPHVVSILFSNLEEVNTIRFTAQTMAEDRYLSFRREIDTSDTSTHR
ncbi:HD-GYP domain-containing protein [Coprothermobacter platensis]|uniref:HD-GYP domain-containing protein n=1 Tax=Coprothermobacter platensis TaxID=108819 RepID=UPI0003676D8A|nr:HD domain-containing protein [Coprothermobacter platensis]